MRIRVSRYGCIAALTFTSLGCSGGAQPEQPAELNAAIGSAADLGGLELTNTTSLAGPEPINAGSAVKYTLHVKHTHGYDSLPIRLRDVLPPRLVPSPVQAVSTVGNVVTETSTWTLVPPAAASSVPTYQLDWAGVMAPDSELVFEFLAHPFPECSELDSELALENLAEVQSPLAPISASASVRVDCPLDFESHPADLGIDTPKIIPRSPR